MTPVHKVFHRFTSKVSNTTIDRYNYCRIIGIHVLNLIKAGTITRESLAYPVKAESESGAILGSLRKILSKYGVLTLP